MKRKWMLLLMLSLLLIGYSLGQAVQASDPLPGSDQDPLVTKSYVDNYISSHYTDLQEQLRLLTRQVQQLETQVARLQERIKIKIELVIGEKTAYVGNDARTLPVAPYIAGGGHTMLPFRFIGEALGAEIGWDGSTRTVSYTLGDKVLKLQIDSKTATVNGREVPLDVAPTLKDNHTVVPVRVVSECLGATVKWSQETQTVTIIP